MRTWRLFLWLVPLTTLIPLGLSAKSLFNTDFSSDFAGISVAGIVVLVVVPNLAILAVSVVGAVLASRGRSVVALLILAAVCAFALSPVVWSPEFWRVQERTVYLLQSAVPGLIALLLGLWGLLMLRGANRTIAMVSAALLLVPVVSAGAGVAAFQLEVARTCPPGPSVDLTFSGLQNAHFGTSCGVPRGIATLAECTSDTVALEMFDQQSWDLSFHPYTRTVTSDEFSYWAPDLIVGGDSSYGGPFGWRGSYTMDPNNQCGGTVDADLFASAEGPTGGAVHVRGRFEAP